MKKEEAVERIREHIKIHFKNEPYAIYISEALYMGIEALEKQMPKTITHEASLYKCCTCPNCKNVVDKFEQFGDSVVRVTYNYCHFCGQALDWNDHPTEKGGVRE